MIIEKIESYLRGKGQTVDEALLEASHDAFVYSIKRQLMEERGDPSGLRGSNPGPCARKMAYAFHEFPRTKELEPRSKITFLTGDLIELCVVCLIKLAGIEVEGTILDEEGQVEGYFDVGNGLMVPCHPDGLLPAQAGLNEPHLLEVKSINHFSYQRDTKKNVIGDQYLLQHNVYLEAYGYDYGVFIYLNKNTGHMHEIYTEKDPELVEKARKNYTLAGLSSPDALPPRYEDGENYGRWVDKNEVKTNKLAWGCCLTEDSEIVTEGTNIIQISDASVGTRVMSSDGNIYTVKGVSSRPTQPNEKVYEIKPLYLRPIKVTEDHPILVKKRWSAGVGTKGEFVWVSAEELNNLYTGESSEYKGGTCPYLVYPFEDKVRDIYNLDEDLLWLLGIYTAEGNIDKNECHVNFTLSIEEEEIASKIINIAKERFGANLTRKTVIDKRNGNKYARVKGSSSDMCKFIRTYINGKYSYTKSLSEQLLLLPIEKQKHLIDGMIDGDGCRLMTRDAPTVVYSTTSRALAYQYHEMLLRAGIVAGISKNDPSKTRFGDKEYDSRATYHVRYFPEASTTRGIFEGNKLLTPLQYIKEVEYAGNVWDINVPGMNDFKTISGIVHNSYCDFLHHCWNVETKIERGKPAYYILEKPVSEEEEEFLDLPGDIENE
jgi:hypothetical protein